MKAKQWGDHGPLSELAGQYAVEKREGYRALVESAPAKDDEDLREALKRSNKAVGGRKFCRLVEKEYREAAREKRSRADVAMRRVEVGPDPAAALAQVCSAFKVESESLRKRRDLSDARLAAATLLKAVTGLSQREIGKALGLADGSGLGNPLAHADRRIEKNRALRRTVARLRANA